MIRFRSFASGSSANAGLLVCGRRRFLVDAGLSATRLLALLAAEGCGPGDLEGVIVTHEHGDHIAGLARFCRGRGLPLYATAGTLAGLPAKTRAALADGPLSVVLRAGRALDLGEGAVLRPLAVSHDAREPIGLRVDCRGLAFALVTDLGEVGATLAAELDGVDLLVLECNHDEALLRRCRYPDWLKRRIRGTSGHLANREALELLAALRRPPAEVLLAHVSEEANHPAQIAAAFAAACATVPSLAALRWSVAPRHAPTPRLHATPRPVAPAGQEHEGPPPRPGDPARRVRGTDAGPAASRPLQPGLPW